MSFLSRYFCKLSFSRLMNAAEALVALLKLSKLPDIVSSFFSLTKPDKFTPFLKNSLSK